MNFEKISMTDLHRLVPNLDSRQVILDVRTPEEFADGHIKGALNIPHDQLGAHLPRLRTYGTLYVHCRSGKRAEVAAQTLLKAGITNFSCVTNSGMEDWVKAGFPVEKVAAKP